MEGLVTRTTADLRAVLGRTHTLAAGQVQAAHGARGAGGQLLLGTRDLALPLSKSVSSNY